MKHLLHVIIVLVLFAETGVGARSENFEKPTRSVLTIGGGDPDSVWMLGIQYHHFRQYYDSCYVNCTFGEILVTRADGSRDAINLRYFMHGSEGPIGFDSYAFMRDSSRSYYFDLGTADTVWYYKSLQLVQKYTSTVFLGQNDTLYFITQVIDSTTGDVCAILDTSAIIVADSVRNSCFYFGVDPSLPGNLHYFTRPATSTFEKVALTIHVEFHSGSAVNEDNLCRFDATMPYRLSYADEYEDQIFRAILDSLVNLGLGKPTIGFARPTPYSFNVWPNPVSQGVAHVEFRPVYNSDFYCLLFNVSGKQLWKSEARSVIGGQQYSLSVPLEIFPSGTYYVIPVINGMFQSGSEIRLIK